MQVCQTHPDYDGSAIDEGAEDLSPRVPSAPGTPCSGGPGTAERPRAGSVLSKAGYRPPSPTLCCDLAKRRRGGERIVGRKMNAPIDAYHFLEKVAAGSGGYLLAGIAQSAALSKIRAYLIKWRPLRSAFRAWRMSWKLWHGPGPKFDAIVEQVFGDPIDRAGKRLRRSGENSAPNCPD